MNTVVQALYDAGVDAQSNLFYADFDLSDPRIEALMGVKTKETPDKAATKMTVRLEGFTPPEVKQDTYTNFFGTAWLDAPKAFVDVTRSFPLKFRVDNNYTLYKNLLAIQLLNMNATTAQVGNNPVYFNITIKAITGKVDGMDESKNKFVDLYKFEKCWIKKLSAPEFKTGDAGPVTVEASIAFFNMKDFHNSEITLE